jgi:hypothetical protein
MEKIKYEIDPHNRLVAGKTGAGSRLRRFRKVLDGRFRVDKNNNLSYHVKAPMPGGAGIPHQVKLRGRWSLAGNHTLKLTLDKWGRQTFGDMLTLWGDIKDVDKNSLLFAVTTKTGKGSRSAYALKLRGLWVADRNNRLTFRVRRERGRYDILTLDGIWGINRAHQIIYRYKSSRLIRKSKRVHTLTFKGHWDIPDKSRISYIMDKKSGSVFSFRAALGAFKANYIKYEIGIGLSRKPEPLKRVFTLFGAWRIRKNAGLLFEVEYANGKVHALVFGADARLTGRDTISVKLKNSVDEEMGVEVKLSHEILEGDGEAFLRCLKAKGRSAALAGAGWRW